MYLRSAQNCITDSYLQNGITLTKLHHRLILQNVITDDKVASQTHIAKRDYS